MNQYTKPREKAGEKPETTYTAVAPKRELISSSGFLDCKGAGLGKNKANSSNGANLGFEASLWAAADKLRSDMDAAEYKHVVLCLIFLKYVSDAFEEKHAKPFGSSHLSY